MEKTFFKKRAQSRGDSGFARVLTVLVLMLTMSTGAWAQANEGWLSGITNGDFSGDDVSSFFKKEYPSTETVPVVIDANAGKDGTPGIVVKTATDQNAEPASYDSQFFIVLPEEMPAGTTIRVQFDYKASKAAKASTECHAAPQSYLYWQAMGDVNFTTEWKTFNAEFTVPNQADGMKSIAFNLQHELSATDYYFDNFNVMYKKSEWTNIIANSDMEGTDVSCFYVHEQGKKGIFLPRITEGIGVDGSRAIKLQSKDDEENIWDTQFFFRLPYVLPKGTMYRLSFDYKADKAGDFAFQLANEPNQYIWWTLDGWPAPGGSFTTEWQHYKMVFTVPTECDGISKSGEDDWLMQFRTIYANLSYNKVATKFIFDNVKVEILSDVLSTLTPEPVTDPELMIMAPPYTVTLSEGIKDADKWTITPAEATTTGVDKDATITLNYTGKKKVKSVSVTKKEAAEPISGTIYSWESPSGTPIETGGTIAYVNGDGDRLNYLNSGYYTICLNGKKNNIGDETASANAGRMDITLDEALAAGDVISITGYITKNETKKASAYIIFNGENGFDNDHKDVYAESEAFSDNENIDQNFNGSIGTKTITVPAEAAGCTNFSMTRGQTGTNLFITKLEIIRGE